MIPTVAIQFGTCAKSFVPGQAVTCTFRLVDVAPEEVERVEFSVLWYTEGKGDEEMRVVLFRPIPWQEHVQKVWEAMEDPDREESDTTTSASIVVDLPYAPLSYYGMIFKIRWAAHVRVFLKNGREFASKQVFRLGDVPMVKMSLN